MSACQQRRRPCGSCPYLLSTPPGVWHPDEYRELLAYDADTASQPQAVFGCHDDGGKWMCQGWLDCHGAKNLLAIRVAVAVSSLPSGLSFKPSGSAVYSSAAEVVESALVDGPATSPTAHRVIDKLENRR